MRSRAWRFALYAVLLIAAFLAVSFIYILLVSIGPSSACRSPTDAHIQPGTTSARPLISGGQERCYQLYVPPGYDPAHPHPLVVVLHGLASNGDMIHKVTGWDRIADREGLVTVYPDGMGYPLRWNANPNMELEVDDIQFFRDLVAEISTLVSVDPERVYVNGFSNGATMSAVIGCRAADVVAAIGLVDPGILTGETLEGCSPARPVPGIEFVGTGDVGTASRGELDKPHQEFTPFLGWLLRVDADYEALPLHTWGKRWAVLNGCNPIAGQLETTDSVTTIHYLNCQQGGDVVVYVLEGMGHQWPGGDPFPTWLMGTPNEEVRATEEMWAFFEAHPLEIEIETEQ